MVDKRRQEDIIADCEDRLLCSVCDRIFTTDSRYRGPDAFDHPSGKLPTFIRFDNFTLRNFDPMTYTTKIFCVYCSNHKQLEIAEVPTSSGIKYKYKVVV